VFLAFVSTVASSRISRVQKESTEAEVWRRAEKRAMWRAWSCWKINSKDRRDKYKVVGEVVERIMAVFQDGARLRIIEALGEIIKEGERKENWKMLDKARKANERKRRLKTAFNSLEKNRNTIRSIKQGTEMLNSVLITKATKAYVLSMLKLKGSKKLRFTKFCNTFAVIIRRNLLERGLTKITKAAERDKQIMITLHSQLRGTRKLKLQKYFSALKSSAVRRAKVDGLRVQLEKKINDTLTQTLFSEWKCLVLTNPSSLYSIEQTLKEKQKLRSASRAIGFMRHFMKLKKSRKDKYRQGVLRAELGIRRVFGFEFFVKMRKVCDWKDSLEFYSEKIEKVLATSTLRSLVDYAKQQKSFGYMVDEFKLRHLKRVLRSGYFHLNLDSSSGRSTHI
jgi:hypothetical protein